MSYNAIVDMARSTSLANRITASAAQEGVPNPEGWARENMWKFASSAEWADAWSSATENLNANQNPDIGYRTDVISDAMILSAVQAASPSTV